jgi:hypothetical protein
MKGLSPILAAVVFFLGARVAEADDQPVRRGMFAMFEDEENQARLTPEPPSATEPGYFNGIGTLGREWELRSDSAFSTSRIATQRFELAGMVPWKRLWGLVVRTDFGGASDTNSGFYSVQGPLVSLGGRFRSESGDEWIEFGLRLIPPWGGRDASDPASILLALNATLTSAQADDARWLNFASGGYQVYLQVQSRFEIPARWLDVALGAHYGGVSSLAPLSVQSWLGTQRGVVGNVFGEGFADVRRLFGWTLDLQLGVRGEASLSSIWPGNASLPLLATAFLGWSPKTWVEVQIYYGLYAGVQGGSLPPAVPPSNPYGARLAFFVPNFG